MKLCDYGCGNQSIHQFKNGKFCCSKHYLSCPNMKKRLYGKNNISLREDVKKKKLKTLLGHYVSEETKRKISKSRIGQPSPRKGVKLSEETKKKIPTTRERRGICYKGKNNPNYGNKLTIEKIKIKYPFFSTIEDMRYNLEKEIQVRCKNHLCKNSKEKNGWFTPSYIILYERIRSLEKKDGTDGAYFYCSEECKNICPLYNLRSDPYKVKNIEIYYTQNEYQTFRKFVLERDNYICQYCEEVATEVHHERPQKLEPFFALDPDYAWSCCEKCHYEKGHKNECSTGNLAQIICIS